MPILDNRTSEVTLATTMEPSSGDAYNPVKVVKYSDTEGVMLHCTTDGNMIFLYPDQVEALRKLL